MSGGFPIVLIDWVDSHRSGGWTMLDELCETVADTERMNCRSVGFLIHKSSASMTLALNVGKNQAADCMTIPRVAIRKVTYLRGKR